MSYTSKANDSFKTKLNLFMYYVASNNGIHFSVEEFTRFEIQDNLVKEYTAVYWQQKVNYLIRGKKIESIHNEIQTLKKNKAVIENCKSYYLKEIFPKVFSKEEYDGMTSDESAPCFYCGINKHRINRLANSQKLYKKNLRGWNMEIDRFNSNYEYNPGNCVLCCYWCNNAKTDEFTKDEFKIIGAAIAEVWKSREADADYEEHFLDDTPFIRIVKEDTNEK
jgi:hypothetical protein